MMIFGVFGEYVNIVDVDQDPSLSYHIGKIVIPKNITVSLRSPLLVMKAPFHSLPSLIQMLLYPHWISSFVKISALCNLWSRLSMEGRRYVFLINDSFRYL